MVASGRQGRKMMGGEGGIRGKGGDLQGREEGEVWKIDGVGREEY